MRAIAILLLLLCAACVEVPPPRPAAPPPPDPRTLMSALEQRIVVLVAEERGRLDPNAKPLSIDPELTVIARSRATDMAAKNYLAHTAPDGETSASILMAADASFQGLLGENMAAEHYTPALGVDIDKFAHAFVKTWLDSAHHRENLTYALYNRTGVGAAVNGDTVYVTELFATDLGLGPHTDKPAAVPGPPAATPPAGQMFDSGAPAASPAPPHRRKKAS